MTAIVLDVETTGIKPHEHRVVEICIIDSAGETVIHTYVNPEMPIPSKVIEIHGITDDMVRDAPVFSEIAEVVASAIRSAEAVVGYNPSFDRRFLAHEFHRASIRVRWPVLVCAKRLWDKYDPVKRRLQNAYKRFVDPVGFDGAHSALNDTRACLAVFNAQVEEFGLKGMDWKDLDPNQVEWCGDSEHLIWRNGTVIVNFGKYKGTPLHKTEPRYWRWVSGQDFPLHIDMVASFMFGEYEGRCISGRSEAEVLAWIEEYIA